MQLETAEIDWQNPIVDHDLNRGLLAWWLAGGEGSGPFWGGPKYRDLRNRYHGTFSTPPPTWTGSSHPLGGLLFNGSTNYCALPNLSGLFGSGAATVTFWLKRTLASPAGPSDSGFVSLGNDGSSTATHYPFSDGLIYCSIFYSGRINGISPLSGVDRTQWHQFAVSTKNGANNYRIFQNGQLVTSAAGEAAITMTTAPYLGYSSSVAVPFGGSFGSVRLWNRALSDREIALDYSQSRRGYPDLLRRLTLPVYSLPAAVAYTLAAASGSFTLTGQATTLKAARTLGATSGSFALTGQNATLRRGYPLSAGSGSFVLTGQAATLAAARTLPAGGGVFTLTGQTAGLYHGYPLSAGSGSFTLTGQAATLKAGRAVVAGSGSFTLTGQAASPKAGRLVVASSGTYTLTGQDATLTYTPLGSFTLAADAGSFTLTGQAAGLLAGRTIAAGTGIFTLTGQAAALKSGRLVVAGSGTYTLTGQAATLKATRTLTATHGVFTLTGQAAGLLAGHRLTSGSGSFTFTGQAAGLYRGYPLSAGSGTFTLTGQTATLAALRTLAATAGSFTLTGQAATLTYSNVVPPVVADTVAYTWTVEDVGAFEYTQDDTVAFAYTQADAAAF